MTLVVVVAACAAAGAAVGITLLQTRGEQRSEVGVTKPRKGFPPLLLDLGLRDDPQAAALRRANALYDRGKQAAASRIFDRYGSLDARIGAAFSRWPDGSLERLKQLVVSAPKSSTVELHLGLAYYWSGRTGDAVTAWRIAESAQPDTPAAVHASDLLHPSLPIPGLPPFTPSFGPPAGPRSSPRSPAPRDARTHGRSSSTASPCSGSAGASRLSGSSRRRHDSRRTTPRRGSRRPSAASRRHIQNGRSRDWGPWSGSSRMRPRCVSTSECSSCGSET